MGHETDPYPLVAFDGVTVATGRAGAPRRLVRIARGERVALRSERRRQVHALRALSARFRTDGSIGSTASRSSAVAARWRGGWPSSPAASLPFATRVEEVRRSGDCRMSTC